jgi:hypothetical protein
MFAALKNSDQKEDGCSIPSFQSSLCHVEDYIRLLSSDLGIEEEMAGAGVEAASYGNDRGDVRR